MDLNYEVLILCSSTLCVVDLYIKMEPLKTTKWVLTWLCVCPATESTSKFKRMAYVLFTIADYVAHFSALFSHVAYLWKYSSTDLEGTIFAFMGVVTFVGLIYIMASLSLQRKQITDIFRNLSKIYEFRKWSFRAIFR